MKKSLLFILMCLMAVAVSAQTRLLKGTVFDSDGEPLPGATVTVVGNNNLATLSDLNGRFSLSIPTNSKLIGVSFLGFKKQSINIDGKNDIKITLEPDQHQLTEQVVIGYGSQKRSDLTGSITTIDVEDLQLAPVKSFDEALAGRVAGVQVVSSEGQPGSAIDVVIRGGNSITGNVSPLYVIDGFPIEDPNGEQANPINALDPNDIESMTVLKDASATAIYGARAANGVVIINTKRGSEGKTTITYNGYYGWQSSNKRLDVLDPYEFVKLQNEIDPVKTKELYLTKKVDGGPSELIPIDYYKNIKGINWENQVMQTAPIKSHYLSMAGGSKQTKFNASLSFLDQEGIIINSGFERGQGRIGFDHDFNSKLKISANVSYSRVFRYGTPVSTSGYNSELNLLFSVWAYRPIPLLNSSVDLVEVPNDPEIEQGAEFRYNPIITTKNELRENTEESLVANGYLEYTLLKGLKLKASGGYTRRWTQSDIFNNSLSRSGNPSTNSRVNGGQAYTNTTVWLNENTMTYDLKIDENQSLNVLAGMTAQASDYRYFAGYAKELPNEGLGIYGLDEGIPTTIGASGTGWRLFSYLARANYNLKSKYLLTASYRSDGSSRFGDNHKWSNFYSGAFAWRANTEDFLKDLKWLSNAKLRASWGMTGNNNLGNFSYQAQYATPINAGYMFGNTFTTGSYPYNMGNSDMVWETTRQTDAGIDLGFFKQRLTMTLDLYRKNTSDLLLDAKLPPSSGYGSQYLNIGKVRNEGLELTVTGVIVENKRFRWASTFNISFNKNKVIALGDGERSRLTSQYWGDDWRLIPGYIARVGEPVAQFYGHIADGVYQLDEFELVGGNYILKDEITTNGEARASVQPGDAKYKDLNGDLKIDEHDRTVIGNPQPIHTGGFNNKFVYRDFDLNVFFQWSYGNDIYNANRLMLETGYKYNTNQYASYANRWSPDNQSSDIPAAKGSTLKTYSTRIVEDGSYLRLKTVSIGYTLPRKLLRPLGVSSVRVYATAQNLYTWTNYSGYDPEVSVRRSALTPGFDYSAYPRAKTLTLGTSITF